MALVGESGVETAAVYLLGYAAELALKVAECELLGVPAAGDPWSWIGSNLSSLGLGRVRDVRTHDLQDLYEQARDRREGIGLDTRDPAFHGSLQFHT